MDLNALNCLMMMMIIIIIVMMELNTFICKYTHTHIVVLPCNWDISITCSNGLIFVVVVDEVEVKLQITKQNQKKR